MATKIRVDSLNEIEFIKTDTDWQVIGIQEKKIRRWYGRLAKRFNEYVFIPHAIDNISHSVVIEINYLKLKCIAKFMDKLNKRDGE